MHVISGHCGLGCLCTSVTDDVSVARLHFMYYSCTCLISGQGGLGCMVKVAETFVPFTFFSKTLDPLGAKNGSKQVITTQNVGFW